MNEVRSENTFGWPKSLPNSIVDRVLFVAHARETRSVYSYSKSWRSVFWCSIPVSLQRQHTQIANELKEMYEKIEQN